MSRRNAPSATSRASSSLSRTGAGGNRSVTFRDGSRFAREGSSMDGSLSTRSDDKKNRAPSATTPAEKLKPKFQIWPEFSETEINNEKWDSAHGKAGKPAAGEKGKGAAVSAALFFDDPDGPLILPSSLRPVEWKRPIDHFGEGRTPVVVDIENGGQYQFDLMKDNEHVLHSELIRWIITQIECLFKLQTTKATGTEPPEIPVSPDGNIYNFRPWEQIYAINKIGKGPNIPAYNSYGKYAVRLFWLGSWRKILVDDLLPVDDEGKILLPCTQRPLELWPILLSKALIKVAALDYGGGSGTYEFGDFSPIHCLAGWLPQTITLRKNQKHLVWQLFQKLLPEWKLPEPKKEPLPGEEEALLEAQQQMEIEKEAQATKEAGKGGKPGKAGKEDKKEKKGDKSKDEQIVYEKPEVVLFGSYYDATRKQPLQVTSLSDMADRSEHLRQQGFSHMYSHPVQLTHFRACPLEPPVPPEEIPAWKLIRPRVPKTFPTSEAPEVKKDEEEKPIQSIEVASPFVNYKVSQVPIPHSTSRPTSALSRGSTRATTPTTVIDETDETAPDWDVQEKMRREKEAEEKRLAEEAAAAAAAEVEHAPEEHKKDSHAMLQPPSSHNRKTSKDSSLEAAGKKSASRKSVTKSPTKEKDSKSNLHASSTAMSGAEEAHVTEEEKAELEVEKSKWMDLDEFLECFHCIHVYHKVHTYNYSKTYQDLKNVNKGGVASNKDPGRKSASSNTTASTASDDKSPLFLYVDSLVPTEVLFSMSALCRWNEPPVITGLGSAVARSGRENTRVEGELAETPEPTELASQDTQATLKPEKEVIQPGSLVSEYHCWKIVRVGDAFKRMKTTGVKTISLHLPAGRQVLKMFMKAPFGYHIQMVSASQFHFGTEEDILPLLNKEPVRVLDYCSRLVNSMGKVMQNFSDIQHRGQAEAEYWKNHCPFANKPSEKLSENKIHWAKYKIAAYNMFKDALKSHNPTPDMAFALKVFHQDPTTKNPLQLSFQVKSKKETQPTAPPTKEKGGKHQAVQESAPESDPTEKLEADPNSWFNKEILPEHLISVVKLQKCWRGYLTRKVLKAANPEDKYHSKVSENLSRIWGYVESHADSLGLQLLNNYNALSPDTASYYEFFADRKHHLVYQDYNGSYPEQPANTWYVVFRDVFHVKEDSGSFMLPKVYSALPSLCLRIIDNDTNEELPRTLGERNPGRFYPKNEKGYTFVGVARTGEQFAGNGKYKLRIIGNQKPLPEPVNDVNSNFNIKEIRDYYVPNEKKTIYRQSVKVTDDHMISLFCKVSKPEARFELSVLDEEKPVFTVQGRGQVIVPAFRLEKDQIPPEEDAESTRSPSRGSAKHRKRSSSAAGRSKDGKLSHASSISSGIHDLAEYKQHKYIIQATLLDENWPLTPSNWAFVDTLKAQEKEDMKVVGKPKTPEPEAPKPEATKKEAPKPKAATKKDTKGGKAGDKGRDKGDSRPESVTFDDKKAHWFLRVISDASAAEDIEVKKDTERLEQIKAMKRAWEEMNPGRAEKAKQSRLRYLNSHYIKNPDYPEEIEQVPSSGEEGTAQLGDNKLMEESVASLVATIEEPLLAEPPTPPPPKEILPPLDLTPYMKGDPSKARFVDFETRVREEDAQHQKDLEKFQQFMDEWDSKLAAEQKQRNETKKNHMDFVYKLQAITDSYRETYFRQRESYRWKLLEAERIKQEELLAKQQAEQTEQAELDAATKGKGRKGSGKKNSARKSPVGSAKKGKKK